MSIDLQPLFDTLTKGFSKDEISLVAIFDEDGKITHVFDPTSDSGTGLTGIHDTCSPSHAKRGPDSLDKNGEPDEYLKEPVKLTLLKIEPFEVLVYQGSKKRTIHSRGSLLPHP